MSSKETSTTEDSKKTIKNTEDARTALDHQIELMRDLNSSVARTDRLQLLTVGALVTAFSVIGPENFLSNSEGELLGIPSYWFWFFGILPLIIGLGTWFGTFFSQGILPVSEIKLGGVTTQDSIEDCIMENKEEIEEWETWVAKYQQRLYVGILSTIAALVMFLM